jgi:hypothetical protein
MAAMNHETVSMVLPIAIPLRLVCGFLGRRRIVARAIYPNFCAAAQMTPSDSVSVAFGADFERHMAKLKMVESA